MSPRMRKQYDSLWALAINEIAEDPFSGALFVFSNKDRSCVKMLWWDGSGVWIFSKRLEKGRFNWPSPIESSKLTLPPEALTMLLAGIDLKDVRKRNWYEPSCGSDRRARKCLFGKHPAGFPVGCVFEGINPRYGNAHYPKGDEIRYTV